MARATPPPSRTRRRRAGRPGADQPDLRELLLDTAIAQFARHGIAATSLRAIASAAAVTPALLHYYFGDKSRLTQALLDERLLPALGGLRAQLEQVGDDPLELMEGFARGITEIVTRHPWLPSLWVREVLSEDGVLREAMLLRGAPSLPQMLAQRFAAAQAAGRLNVDLDPRLLMVSLVGLTMFPLASAPVWRGVFGGGELDAGALLKHTLALLRRGTEPA
ncbi:TetR/AcrR family transcriptional regulator [Rhodanobacter glycinis]|uniref:TetR/AcrR family transcriptional regulator n=1 Tax=Rhodanobacter glycinis TaxID=582702 RepID=UPI00112D393D|nr:TetR/AcrR family transcriptional regulator [Rhodanobacter glycinis]TPG47855.1 TetR/AcrR family transcriptional regulator [Rhodanobacter glycinis]